MSSRAYIPSFPSPPKNQILLIDTWTWSLYKGYFLHLVFAVYFSVARHVQQCFEKNENRKAMQICCIYHRAPIVRKMQTRDRDLLSFCFFFPKPQQNRRGKQPWTALTPNPSRRFPKLKQMPPLDIHFWKDTNMIWLLMKLAQKKKNYYRHNMTSC